MNVAMADLNDVALAAAAKEVETLGAEVIALRADVQRREDVEALRDQTIKRFGRVNLVCSNAGVGGRPALIQNTGRDIWDWIFGVNVFGLLNGFQAFVPHLSEHGEGHIVNTASAAGFASGTYLAPYTVSKHAAVALSEAMYMELQLTHPEVGLSCLCPGLTATNIANFDRRQEHETSYLAAPNEQEQLHAEQVSRWIARGRDPSDVAEVVHRGVLEHRFYLFVDNTWDRAILQRQEQINGRLTLRCDTSPQA
jgi:NAD(P)-dependent dehydrogenase (short-subunit alcohol dehydrogenase family)